jgi:hypothetical protein
VDEQGHRGFDVDICRALSAAIFAPRTKSGEQASSVELFLRGSDVDVVAPPDVVAQREGWGCSSGPGCFDDRAFWF